MTKEEFRRIIKEAAKQVANWPEWKRNILCDNLCPRVRNPRKPVDNGEKYD